MLMNWHKAPWFLLALGVLLLDQGTKWLAETHLYLHQPVELLPLFQLTLVYNEGAAFSFLADAGGWQRWAFSIFAILLTIVLSVWLLRLPRGERLSAFALSLVIGGALGNLVDRLRTGRVVDFLDLHWQGWHWPAFNLADSAITLGVALLFLTSLRENKG